MQCPLLFLILGLCAVLQAQQVLVKDKLTGILGQEVNLPCIITDPSMHVSQIMWMKDGINVATYHPNHGEYSKNKTHYKLLNPSISNATLSILQVTADDEGQYACEVTTFPDGNRNGVTTLTVKAVPLNSAQANSVVVAGDQEQVVATCKSANGRPPSRITWQTNVAGNVSTTMTNNSDGTSTVVSQYLITPTWTADGMPISCVINYESNETPIPFKLSVQYKPVVTVDGFDGNWHLNRNGVYLTCNGRGNPPPTSYIWKTADGSPLPTSVRAQGNILFVDEVDERVNRSFLCEVTNALGSREFRQDVLVIEHAMRKQTNAGAIAGGVIGGILFLLLLAAIIFIVIKRGGLHKKDRGTYNPKTRGFGTGNPSQQFTYQDDGELDKPLKSSGPLRDSGLSPSLGEEDEEEEERMKYKVLEDDEEEERFNEVGPMLKLRPHNQLDSYLDDDMESQTDGSFISRTAVYV